MEEEKRDELEEKQEEAEEEREKEEKVVTPKGVPSREGKERHHEERPVHHSEGKHKHHDFTAKHNPKNNDKLLETVRGNPWIAATFVLGAIVLISLFSNFGLTGGVISETKAGQLMLDFANEQGIEADLVEVNKVDNFYEVVLSMNGQNIPLYVTKDGKSFVQGLVSLEDTQTPSQPTPTNVPKSDKPLVELFVMTHCPYGTQAEKGIIPTIKALGNTIDAKIRFVHYYMHKGEKQEPYETPIQVCIREEQSDKYYNYLSCFLEDGDSDRCLTKAGIDKTKLDSCVAKNAEKYYADDSALSQEYGVGGSPTLVINGVIVSSGRDSQSYLDTICSAFNDAPSECDKELSTTSPSPGFGYAEGSDTSAQC